MSTKHTPGPWEVLHSLNRRTLTEYWTVSRKVGAERERLTNCAGRTKRFRSPEAAERARAALAKATGGQP